MDKRLEQLGFKEGKVYAIVGTYHAYAVELRDGKLYKGDKDYTDYAIYDFNVGFVKARREIPLTTDEYYFINNVMNRYHYSYTVTHIEISHNEYYSFIVFYAKSQEQDELRGMLGSDYRLGEMVIQKGTFAQLEHNRKYDVRLFGLKGLMVCD